MLVSLADHIYSRKCVQLTVTVPCAVLVSGLKDVWISLSINIERSSSQMITSPLEEGMAHTVPMPPCGGFRSAREETKLIGMGSKAGLGRRVQFLYTDNFLNTPVGNLLRSPYWLLRSGPSAVSQRSHFLDFQEGQVYISSS